MVSGTLNETQRVPVPKGSLEFIFHVNYIFDLFLFSPEAYFLFVYNIV